MTDFQLSILDVLTTPDEEYARTTEVLNEEEFDLLDFLEEEID
jgi:hypothetical protein